jgi:hypothetical protein
MEFGKPHAYRELFAPWKNASDAENAILQTLQFQ